jgi:hypothetical protein
MTKVAATGRPGHFQSAVRPLVTWLIRGFLVLLIAILLLGGVGASIGSAFYLGYLATRATVFDTWGVLSIISMLLSVIAIAGAGFALRRRKLILALGFAALTAPAPLVIEASRCDTTEACRMMGWAALPAKAFTWEARLRPVTDANEARSIASTALSKAGSSNFPFKARWLEDHWIVSAIDQDGWPGPHAVSIDTRSAETSLVACPADKVQCGMERPTLSDGRTAFRNARLGIAAIFPAPRPVCTSRGPDDEPRGFFSMVRAPDIPCEILDQSRAMGVEVARSRKKGCISAEAPSAPWRPLSPETARLFSSPAPTLGGQPSVACELRQGGQIQISIYAAAPSGLSPRRSLSALYEGYIVTTPAYLAEDVRSFEVFLASVRISSLADKRTD